jgi:hypothetical protein
MIRACTTCKNLLTVPTIITLHIQLSTVEAINMAGNLIHEWPRTEFPHIYDTVIKDVIIGCKHRGVLPMHRWAADGYAYSKPQFEAYYTTQHAADHMWDMAAHRTVHLKILHNTTIITEQNIEEWRLKWVDPDTEKGERFPPMLLQIPGFRDYIPPQLWPFQPVGCERPGSLNRREFLQLRERIYLSSLFFPEHEVWPRFHGPWGEIMAYSSEEGAFATGDRAMHHRHVCLHPGARLHAAIAHFMQMKVKELVQDAALLPYCCPAEGYLDANLLPHSAIARLYPVFAKEPEYTQEQILHLWPGPI